MSNLLSTVRMKKTLRNEHIIPIDPEIATILGLNESIIVQQIHYWLCINEKANRNYVNNKYWTYNSLSEWHQQLPFISESTIKRALASLETMKVIISGQHSVDKFDKTKWYTIDYEKLDSVLNGSVTDRSGQNDPIGNIGENSDSIHKQSLKPAIFPSGQNDLIEQVNLTRCYTDTNNTYNKERDAREINFNDWIPDDIESLKTKYGLSNDEINNAPRR